MAQAYLTNKERYWELKTKLLPQRKPNVGNQEWSVLHGTTMKNNTTLECYEQRTLCTQRYENSMLAQTARSAQIHVICITSHVASTYFWDRWVRVAVNARKCGSISFLFARSKKNACAILHWQCMILAQRSSTIFSSLKLHLLPYVLWVLLRELGRCIRSYLYKHAAINTQCRT